MARHKDMIRNLSDAITFDTVKVAVLMDIRDELKKLNRVFECHNFLAVPNLLRGIEKNTKRKPRKSKP